jgi:hypothetical protein
VAEALMQTGRARRASGIAAGIAAVAVLVLPLVARSDWRQVLVVADAAALAAALAGGVAAIGLWRGGAVAWVATAAALGIAVLGWGAPLLGWTAEGQLMLGDAALGVPIVAAAGAANLGPVRAPALRALAACGASPAVIFGRVVGPRLASGIGPGVAFVYVLSIVRERLASRLDARSLALACLPVLLAAGLIVAAGRGWQRRGWSGSD